MGLGLILGVDPPGTNGPPTPWPKPDHQHILTCSRKGEQRLITSPHFHGTERETEAAWKHSAPEYIIKTQTLGPKSPSLSQLYGCNYASPVYLWGEGSTWGTVNLSIFPDL